MKVEYETEIADLDAYYAHFTRLPEIRREYRKRARTVALSVGAVIFVMAAIAADNVIGAAIAALAVAVPVFLLYPSVLRHETAKASKRQVLSDPASPALGPHTLEVTSEGVSETCTHHTLSVRWTGVRSIRRTSNHLFVCLTDLSAFIVPLRSLSAQDADDLQARLEEAAPTDIRRDFAQASGIHAV